MSTETFKRTIFLTWSVDHLYLGCQYKYDTCLGIVRELYRIVTWKYDSHVGLVQDKKCKEDEF